MRVGDVSLSDGRASFVGSKEVDVVHSRMRTAYLQMMLIDGQERSELLASDVGRELILPSLRKQAVLRNNVSAGDLAFGAIDGTPVPDQFIETWALEGEVSEVTIATDGYPVIRPTLELLEQYLRSDLRSDPLRIGKHMTTKGVRPGNQSFDDRAYVRLRKQ